jgi:5-(aminomethyl)-3-furanmethanol phosphate kinase
VPEPRPVVVKIGGGLLRAEGMEGLRRGCADVVAAAQRRPVLVVPGGGPFADAVRAVDSQVSLADDIAHVLALRAMDQLGVLLAQLLPDAERRTDLVSPRALALLEVEAAFAGRPEVPESWAVTSDSLAVLAAAAIGAEEAVLLKPVAGVLAHWPSDEPGGSDPIPALTAAELRELQARGGGRVVDAYLYKAVTRTGVSAVVRAPNTVGTRISPH